MKSANLRVCMHCEWVFRKDRIGGVSCPKCEWPSYGARCVYGDRAYVYEKTQKPWKKRKISALSVELDRIIRSSNQPNTRKEFPRE